MAKKGKLLDVSHALSVLCALALGAVLGWGSVGSWVAALALVFLAMAVMLSVHHAEVIAVRVGPRSAP